MPVMHVLPSMRCCNTRAFTRILASSRQANIAINSNEFSSWLGHWRSNITYFRVIYIEDLDKLTVTLQQEIDFGNGFNKNHIFYQLIASGLAAANSKPGQFTWNEDIIEFANSIEAAGGAKTINQSCKWFRNRNQIPESESTPGKLESESESELCGTGIGIRIMIFGKPWNQNRNRNHEPLESESESES